MARTLTAYVNGNAAATRKTPRPYVAACVWTGPEGELGRWVSWHTRPELAAKARMDKSNPANWTVTTDVRERETSSADPAKAAKASEAAKRAAVTRRWNENERLWRAEGAWAQQSRDHLLREAYEEHEVRELRAAGRDLEAQRIVDAPLYRRLAGSWNCSWKQGEAHRPGYGRVDYRTGASTLEAYEAVHQAALDDAAAVDALLEQAQAGLQQAGYVEPVVRVGLHEAMGSQPQADAILARLAAALPEPGDDDVEHTLELQDEADKVAEEEERKHQLPLEQDPDDEAVDDAVHQHVVQLDREEAEAAERITRWAEERLAESRAEREARADAQLAEDAELQLALRAFPAYDGSPRVALRLFRYAHTRALELNEEAGVAELLAFEAELRLALAAFPSDGSVRQDARSLADFRMLQLEARVLDQLRDEEALERAEAAQGGDR